MVRLMKRFGSVAALAASVSLVATPAAAVEVPQRSALPQAVADQLDETAEHGRHHRRGSYRHYRDDIDLGDVIAGAVIIGAILIASDNARDADERYRERGGRYGDYDYDYDERYDDRYDERYDDRYGQSHGEQGEVYEGSAYATYPAFDDGSYGDGATYRTAPDIYYDGSDGGYGSAYRAEGQYADDVYRQARLERGYR